MSYTLKPEAPEPELGGYYTHTFYYRVGWAMSMMICTWTGTLAAILGDWITPHPCLPLNSSSTRTVPSSLWGISRSKSQLHPTAICKLDTRSCTGRRHAVCLALRRQLLAAIHADADADAVAQHPCPLSGPNRQGPVRDFQIRCRPRRGAGCSAQGLRCLRAPASFTARTSRWARLRRLLCC